MRRHLLLAVAVGALTLLTAPPALAKGIGSVKACGADGCTDVTSRGHDESIFNAGSYRGGPPDRRAPFYRVHMVGTDGAGAWTFRFVPKLAVTASRNELGVMVWFALDHTQLADLRRLVAGVRPFPARLLSLAVTRPRTARVVETVAPAPPPAHPAAGADTPWWAIALGGLLAVGAGGALLRVRASRTPAPAEPTTAPR